MTTISSTVIAHSTWNGKAIVTLSLIYPRFIHGELMTHRVFSRNAMSSRAVPVHKMIDQVRHDPFVPLYWGKNQPGMQAREELTGDELQLAQANWRYAAIEAANRAEAMNAAGLHKQIANRVLEPFQWMHTLVTATEWDNFFALRCHPDAEPHFQQLAYAMRDSIAASVPVDTSVHLPYASLKTSQAFMVSAARCARVSYNKHDGAPADPTEDYDLAVKLRDAGHLSPFEHCATAAHGPHANFVGWRSFRNTMGY